MLSRKNRFVAALCGATLMLTMAAPVMAALPIDGTASASTTSVAVVDKVTMESKGGTPAPSIAQPKIKQEEAVKIAQDTFDIPAEFGTPNVNYWAGEKPSQTQTYNISWNNPNPLTSIQENYNVDVDASTGLIRSYYHYRYDPTNPNNTPALNREEALPKAETWLQKIQPKLVAEVKLDESNPDPMQSEANLSFRWNRMVNGLPFPEDGISITINPVDGTLANYNGNWTVDAVFPAADKVRDLATAQTEFDKTVQANLTYQRFYQAMGEPNFSLAYLIGTGMIDAQTGTAVDGNGQVVKTPQPVQLPTSDQKLTKLPTRLDKEGALSIARQVLGDLAKDEPTNVYFSENDMMSEKYGGSKDKVGVWNFSWQSTTDKAQYSYYSASVDADYGVVMNFSRDGMWLSDDQFKDKTPVDEAVARQTAIDFLVKNRPDLLSQVRLLDRSVLWTGPMGPGEARPIQREYSFNFERLANNIPVANDQVNVVVDRFSGVVRNMWINWTRKEFAAPQADQVISVDQIKTIIKDEMPLQLQYRRIWSNKEGKLPEIKLIYAPLTTMTNILDAANGHLLDWSGRDLTEARQPITDIVDHPYEREIKQMITRNVFTIKDGKFNPEGTVTRGEVAKAIVTAVGQGDIAMKMAASRGNISPSYNDVSSDNPYFAYIEFAVRNGIFQPASTDDKFNADTLVTNEDFALYVARAMGYGEIVKMKPAIEVSYTDQAQISAASHNAVGLLTGLEVLSGQGEFKPAAELTRADAAKILTVASQKTVRNRIYY